MKTRLRTEIWGSKTVNQARYNLSFQLTADAIGYLEVEVKDEDRYGRKHVTAEAYILNCTDRKQLVELLDQLEHRHPSEIITIARIKEVIGYSSQEADMQLYGSQDEDD